MLHNRALFVYDAAMKQWIYQYKGLGDYRLHDAFQDLIAAQLQNARTLVAIPSESKHYDVRGFDPIQGLFGGLQLQPWLRKSPTAKPQAQKNRRERLQTPQSFTVLVPAAKLNQTKQITLVDDLYTTGRTLYHARDALVAAGFQGMVTAFTLIR
ncbi:ComF family protein [Lacticaseibacillus paracasei]|uniref:ComF family protein n=1 Tax=Lacticaseibacillus paracasei TaxID=1597 RepID=UPI000977BAAA|nr:ComF family protein [Lacticaseibacillus paracasei]MDK6821991.1 ComF family protein [Lacticaseibacillus paracasei]MDK7798887.1 ComF family protein [Lacticaseibacillus paracasei]UYX01691.1 ComF family protein [Lacticaseibacillus paracasei subsp. tolerans]UYX04675.1 ComF family protein [Lacticaseibacillus paracasei subsp. tolerans]